MGEYKLGNDYFKALNKLKPEDAKIIDLTKLYTFSKNYSTPEKSDLEKEIKKETLDKIPSAQNPNYNMFTYAKIDDHKKPIFLSEYLMGNAWGMVSLYNEQPFIAKRLEGNRVLSERVAAHEGYKGQGHLTFRHDEVLTRIHTNTLDTSPFSTYDKYGA